MRTHVSLVVVWCFFADAEVLWTEPTHEPTFRQGGQPSWQPSKVIQLLAKTFPVPQELSESSPDNLEPAYKRQQTKHPSQLPHVPPLPKYDFAKVHAMT